MNVDTHDTGNTMNDSDNTTSNLVPPIKTSKKKREKTVYLSLKQYNRQYGTPIDVLKACKELKADGVTTSGYNVIRLQPWIEANENQIEEVLEDTTDDKDSQAVKLENLKKVGILKDLEIAQKRNQLVYKDDVKDMLNRMATIQNSLLNSKLKKEVLPKMIGKELPDCLDMIDAFITEYIEILRKPLEKWIEKE